MRERLLDEDGTYRNNQLLELFSDFRILRYDDTVARPDRGIEFPKDRLVRLEAQKGDIQHPACDWKGIAKPTTAKVQWGVITLVCTDSGWIRVEK